MILTPLLIQSEPNSSFNRLNTLNALFALGTICALGTR